MQSNYNPKSLQMMNQPAISLSITFSSGIFNYVVVVVWGKQVLIYILQSHKLKLFFQHSDIPTDIAIHASDSIALNAIECEKKRFYLKNF